MIVLLYLQIHGEQLLTLFKFSVYSMRVEAVRVYGSVDNFIKRS
jgi:hypothetical protein